MNLVSHVNAEDMNICMFYSLHFVHNFFQLSIKDTCLIKIQADCKMHIVRIAF